MGSVKQSAVETLPLVTRPMRDMRCCDGDSVVLECSVHGSPEPDIRWEKDGRIVHLGEEMRSSLEDERARLHIARVYPEDEGVYTCVASNNLGKATTSACLIVDVAEEKEWLVSGELSRPTAIRSAGSTPRSTPRSTPARSPSPNVTRGGHREYTGMESRRQIKCSPRFYSVPHDRVAEEGETVRMTASARGMPSPWTTWTKDGKPVTPSARLSVTERDDLRVLEIRAVTKEDAGTYRVALENDYGRVESSARLDVIVRGSGGRTAGTVRAWGSSPSFSRRLSGSTSHLGTDFTFSADVQSTPSPSISWYRNGKMLVRTEKVVPTWDGRTARLEVFGLEEEDAGVYTCVAENCMGRTRCSAELVVLGPCKETSLKPPVFVQGLLDSSTATEGQPFELLVQLQGSEPMDAVWIKDGVEVPDCPDFRYVSYGKGRFGLRIADPFTADSGVYNCEVFSQHGEAVSTTVLRVIDNGFSDEPNEVNLKRLHFTKTPTPVITSSGSSAKFCVKVSNPSDREPNFIWEIAGNAVKANSERFKVKSEGDESVFEISPVAEGDTCEVFCEVTVCVCEDDCEGCLSAKTGAQLRVSTPPDRQTPARILSGPADTTALAGDRVILQATFQGHPKPNVRWLRQGREMETSARVRVDTGKGVTCLVLEPVLPDDSAKYILTVENSLGSDCGFASLAVEGCPEPPSGAPCVSQSGSGAVTVAWSSPPYDGGSKITGYTVEISESDKDSWTTLTDRCLCLSHIAQDLKLGTCYSFRVRSHNIHGASEPSPQSSPLLIKTFEKEEETSSPEVEHKQVQVEPGQVFREGYDVLEELGKGRYGVVHKVVSKEGSRSMAAKFVRCIMKQDREKVYEEIDIMNCLRHPKLLQLYAAYENPKDIIMIMEYISGGELFERVVADDFTLTEKDCILFMRQICDGVGYMHRNSVVHLDLKPENIMCSTRTSHQIKLIDFGLAQKLKPDSQIRVLQGTPEFIPPEIVNYEPIGTESDMWSVGVICYVLLSGLSPFMGDSDTETFTNITRADYDFEDEAFESISKDAKDFISALLIKRKEKRLSAEKCLRHKWLAQEDNSMSKVALCTDKLKKFIIHRKWQKTGNAIRALGRMATLSARRNTNNASAARNAGQTRLSSLSEEERMSIDKSSRVSERSDSGFSDCSSVNSPPASLTVNLLSKKFSISEEAENELTTTNSVYNNSNKTPSPKLNNKNCVTESTERVKSKIPSPALQKDARILGSENIQKAFAFWKR